MADTLMLPLLLPVAEQKTECATNIKSVKRGPKQRYLPAILQVLKEQPGTMTDRQVFYRLVTKGIIPNSVPAYNQVCKVLKQSRIDGSIPWERIVDRSKPVYAIDERDNGDCQEYFEDHKDDYENAEETFKDAARYYSVPLWTFQPECVEVWCEKDALAGVLQQVTEKYAIPLVVCRGYQSITVIHDRLPIYENIESEERQITVLYLGDFDPHGENIPQVIVRDFEALGYMLNLQKIALTTEQIQQYKLIPSPCKKKDLMAPGWISTHGDAVYELDALEPASLLQIVETAIRAHFSQEMYEKRQHHIADARKELARLTSEYFGESDDDTEDDTT